MESRSGPLQNFKLTSKLAKYGRCLQTIFPFLMTVVWQTFMIGTSMVKSLRMKEVNSCLTNLFAKLRLFPGAKRKQLSCYRILIHGGCNDTSSIISSPKNVATDLMKLTRIGRRYRMNIFLSCIKT